MDIGAPFIAAAALGFLALMVWSAPLAAQTD